MGEETFSQTRRNGRLPWENASEAARCVNTSRPLTRPFAYTKGGLWR